MTLPICLNAWCFEPDHSYNVTKGRALLKAYDKRAHDVAAEWAALPHAGARGGDAVSADAAGRLARGARRRAGEAEGPAGIFPQAALPPGGEKRPRLRSIEAMAEQRVTIYTDGACSGNPGPGGWGAILVFGDHEKELKGGEAHTTNNRMELMAAIAALEALKRPCTVDLTPTASICATASPAGSTTGSATAGGPPTRSRSRMSICGSGSMRRSSITTCIGTGSRATPATRMNERADELAREADCRARRRRRRDEDRSRHRTRPDVNRPSARKAMAG